MSRLDRRFFEKKLCKKLSGRTPAGFFFLMPSVACSTHGCEAVAAERAVRMRMYFASKADATNVARMSGGRAISRERPERVPTALAPGAQAQ